MDRQVNNNEFYVVAQIYLGAYTQPDDLFLFFKYDSLSQQREKIFF